MVKFATLIDLNTILESNVINSVNFYKNVIEFIFQQISLTKQLYTPPTPFGVLKSLVVYHVSIILMDKMNGIQLTIQLIMLKS
jgi:hypothetical protein